MSKEGASHRTPTPAHLHGPSCPFFKPLLIPPPWRPPTSHFFYPPSSCIKPFSFFVCFLYITLPSGSQLLRSQCRFASWPQPDYKKYASTAASALVLLSFRSAAQKTRTQQPRLDCTAVTVRHSRPRGQTRRGRLHRGPCPISVLSRFCLRTPVPPQLLQGSLQPQPVRSHRETSTRWLHRTSHRTF
ncbi:hypothetical protein M432DRAFT_239336 [Thermoascus aurantiacus ATCC 26904]